MPDQTTMRVLVIDDCDDVRRTVVQMLTTFNCEIVSAASGSNALEKTADSGVVINLAIVDMQMPGLTGVQTLHRLRERNRHLPAVLISGRPESHFNDELDQLSNFVFLQKPFVTSDLARAIALAQSDKSEDARRHNP